MATQQIIELAIALAAVIAGVWLYRRPSPEPDQYGSQGAVLLFAVAAILVVHVVITERARPSETIVEVTENDA